MTLEEAKIIKGWRKHGSTWRRIAERAAEQWPEKGYVHGHQIQGRELCDEAADVLKDNEWDDWPN